MRRLAVLTALLTLALAATASAQRARIVNGTPVVSGNHPWQVAILYGENAGSFAGRQYCGGTLVAPRYVLTADHCAVDTGDRVRAGSTQWSTGGQRLLVEEVLRHPQSDGRDPDLAPRYDVNLLRLSGNVTNAKPLTVVKATESALWAPDALLTVTGWGDEAGGGGDGTLDLREAQVPAASDVDCTWAYPADFDHQDMFCAGYPEGGTDTCQGDSGGPIIAPAVASPSKANPAHWRLVGVTSWGSFCAAPDSPGVYARLGAPVLGDWVRAELAKAPPDLVVPPKKETTAEYEVPVAEQEPAPAPAPEPPPAPVFVPRTFVPPGVTVTRRCTRKRRCTFTIVRAGEVTGVRTTLTSTTKRSCRRKGRRATCKRTTSRRVAARKGAAGTFTVATAALRKGSHTLVVTPLDGAGKPVATPKRVAFTLR